MIAVDTLRLGLIGVLLVSATVTAEPTAVPGYPEALEAWSKGDRVSACTLFEDLRERDLPGPQVVRVRYFSARCDMIAGRWERASTRLIELHRMSPAFCREWNCDYLMGVCRKATGRD